MSQLLWLSPVFERRRRSLAVTEASKQLADVNCWRCDKAVYDSDCGIECLAFNAADVGPIDARISGGAGAIWSQWDGYLKQDRGLALQAELALRSISLEHAHTSSHAAIGDLKRLAAAVAPRMLVPVHTFQPERFLVHVR